jgi:hypothetical protein
MPTYPDQQNTYNPTAAVGDHYYKPDQIDIKPHQHM